MDELDNLKTRIKAVVKSNGTQAIRGENLQATLLDMADTLYNENSGGGSDPAVPTSHASSHGKGGSDPITPKAIGASAEDHAHDDKYAKINGDKAQDFATKNLDVKGLAVFGDAIVMSGYEGGGGGSLPAGNLDEVLYFNGTDWVGKHKDTLGFLTLSALSGYATIDWVTARIPSVPAWALQATKPSYGWSEITSKPTEFTPSAHNQAIATITGLQGVLDTKLAKSIWDSEFNVTSEGLVHKRTAIFNDAIVMSNATGGGGGTTDYNALENLPFIGGVKVSGSKTLADYGLMGFGLATQAWVNTRIPNVSAWALQANKPSYTAIEVGALPITGGAVSYFKVGDETNYGYFDKVQITFNTSKLVIGSNYGSNVKKSAIEIFNGITTFLTTPNVNGNTIYHSGNLVPASITNVGNTLVQRDASGFVFGRIFNGNFPTHNQPFGEVGYRVSPEDGYHRFCSVDYFKSQLGLYHTGNLAPASTGIIPNTLAQRDASGYLEARIFRDNWGLDGSSSIGAVGFKINHADGYHRFCTPDHFKAQLGLYHSGNSNLPTVDWTMRNATANGFRVKDSNGLWQGSKYTSGLRDIDVTLVSTTGNVILFPYAGNVGIGINSPTAKLHVNGNQIVEGTAVFKGAIVMTNY